MNSFQILAPLFMGALLAAPAAASTFVQDEAPAKPAIEVRGHTRADLTLPGMAFLQPARGMFEAYPIGNGTLGTNVFGGVESETLGLASDRLWQDWQDTPGGPVRAQPLAANLELTFTYREGTDYVQEYTRALNFANGVSQTTFETPPAPHDEAAAPADLHGPQHYRTTFASLSHDVLVYHIASDEPLSFELRLTPTENPVGPSEVVFPALGRIALNALAPNRDSATDHIAYQVLCSVVPDDGSMQIGEGAIRVTDTTAAVIFVTIESVLGDDPKDETNNFTTRAAASIDAALVTLESVGVRGLVDTHVAEHERLFKKLFLRIGRAEYEMSESQALLNRYPTTSTRLAGARNNERDTYMPELLYYLGRYLQIASSYGDAKPGNLAGYFGRLSSDAYPLAKPDTFWDAARTGMGELVHPLSADEPSEPSPEAEPSPALASLIAAADSPKLAAALAAIDSDDAEAQRTLAPAIAAMHFARTGQGDRALACIKLFQLHLDLQPNLINQSRPLSIEANLGITAAIGEMLFQVQDDIIQLLPALPKSWDQGQFDGFTTPTGLQVAAGWSKGQLDLAMITSPINGTCQIRLPNRPIIAVWNESRPFLLSDLEQTATRAFPIQYKNGVASWKTTKNTTYAVIPVW